MLLVILWGGLWPPWASPICASTSSWSCWLASMSSWAWSPSEVPRIVWSYHTTPQSNTHETPFSLVYGTDAMIPVEIQESSPDSWISLLKGPMIHNIIPIIFTLHPKRSNISITSHDISLNTQQENYILLTNLCSSVNFVLSMNFYQQIQLSMEFTDVFVFVSNYPTFLC